MNVALVVEPGIRWMCFKNVSIDTAMRYRYSAAFLGLQYNDWIVNASRLIRCTSLPSWLRANYHF